jgi:predicted Fe-S protein YdhL (DUF1289 family)
MEEIVNWSLLSAHEQRMIIRQLADRDIGNVLGSQ